MMDVRNARVAVTGGAGFIGSHLVDRLMAAGNEVVVIDDLSTGRADNLSRHSDNPRFRLEEASVLNEVALAKLLQNVDFVFHLATRNVRLSLRRPTDVHDVNTTGTFNVLKAASTARVKRFLYCSSSEVNGPATETAPIPEDFHFRPQTIYGASKLAGEYYAQVFHRLGWLETVVARPHNNYGPRSHFESNAGELIPRYILLAFAGKPLVVFGDGNQTRDFTYVSETSDFLLRLMECDDAAGGTFNICRGREVSVLTVARLVLEMTGSKSPVEHLPRRPGDIRRLYGDPSRLKSMLGASPRVSIRDGLALTVEWFRENVPLTGDILASISNENWSDAEAETCMRAADGEKPERD